MPRLSFAKANKNFYLGYKYHFVKTLLVCLLLGSSIAYTSINKPIIAAWREVAVVKGDSTEPFQMKQYWITFLYKGPDRTHDSAAAARIQTAHIANIDRLAKEGKIVIAGPMDYDQDLRGIFIINAPDSATAASYVKTDSAIITGRLRFELHPWWTAKGKYEFK